MAHWRLTASSRGIKNLKLSQCWQCKCPALSTRSFSSIVYKTSDEILVSETRFLRKFSFCHKGKSFINKFFGSFLLKTPKTRPINTAERVKSCTHSAGVEADIILHSRWLVRNVHCDWLNIAVRFLNATNRISPFWHTLKWEISHCGRREINVAQCSAIERGYPTMISMLLPNILVYSWISALDSALIPLKYESR